MAGLVAHIAKKALLGKIRGEEAAWSNAWRVGAAELELVIDGLHFHSKPIHRHRLEARFHVVWLREWVVVEVKRGTVDNCVCIIVCHGRALSRCLSTEDSRSIADAL